MADPKKTDAYTRDDAERERLMNLYKSPSKPLRGTAISDDEGESWSPIAFDSSVPDPDCQGSVIGLANGSVALSNANSPTARVDLSVRLGKLVGGPTAETLVWDRHVSRLASPGTAAGYSSLFQMVDGRVGVLWETDGHRHDCKGEGCSIVISFLS